MNKSSKNFVLATLIVLVGAGLVDWVLRQLGTAEEFTKAASALVLASLTRVETILDSRSMQPGPGLLPKGIVRPERFWIPWQRFIVYGTFIFIAAIEVTGLVVGFMAPQLGEASFDNLLMALIPSNIIASGFTAFLLGRWMGTRIDRNGIFTIILVLILGRILVVVMDFLLLSEAQLGGPRTMGFFLEMMASGISLFVIITVISIACGIIGYRRGYQQRLSGYLWYLLSTLPAETRESIIDLVYGEVKTLAPEPATAA